MNHIIRKISNASPEQLDIIRDRFPYGILSEDLITITTGNGSLFRGLRIEANDAIYLFRFDNVLLDELDDNEDVRYEVDDLEDIVNDDTDE